MKDNMAQTVGKWESESGLEEAARLTQWFGDYHTYEPKLGIAEEMLIERYQSIVENPSESLSHGIKKEPAAHPVLEGYTWTHYDDGSGSLESDFGTKLAEYDLTTWELTVNKEYFNFEGDSSCTGLSFIKNKAENVLADQIRCNVIGSYESDHNIPENVRLMKWSSSMGKYYLAANVEEDRVQRRYDYITKIANKKPVVQQLPMCR